MVALTVKNLKQFMGLFLASEAFDEFRITEAVVQTNATFSVDCRVSQGFYSAEELETLGLSVGEALPFSLVKKTFFELIKGSHTPVLFRFALLLPPEDAFRMLGVAERHDAEIGGFFLNLNYREGTLMLTAAVNYRAFAKRKDVEAAWDGYAKAFLDRHGIIFEEID